MRLPEFEDCRDLEQLNGGDYFPQKGACLLCLQPYKRYCDKKFKDK